MIYDARQPHQKQALTCYIGGDYAPSLDTKRYWACRPEHAQQVTQHVLRNPEILNVQTWYHLPHHDDRIAIDIVAVGPSHPYLQEPDSGTI